MFVIGGYGKNICVYMLSIDVFVGRALVCVCVCVEYWVRVCRKSIDVYVLNIGSVCVERALIFICRVCV